MGGWVSIHRKITEHPDYFSEPFTRMGAWLDLILMANHTDGYIRVRGIRVMVKRGQTAITQEKMAERWQWSRGKVKRFLDELQNDGQIVQEKSSVINCVSIVNYNKYQRNDTTNGATNSTADSTMAEQQTVRQTDINNKDNKVYNENKENTHTRILESKTLSRAHAYETRAREMLDWLSRAYPEMMTMPEPLTLPTAIHIVAKYQTDDIRRIFADMHNKGVEKKNRDTLASFYSFAGRDTILKERRSAAVKYYTFDEMADLIPGKYKQSDFERVEVSGKILWAKKVDQINIQP